MSALYNVKGFMMNKIVNFDIARLAYGEPDMVRGRDFVPYLGQSLEYSPAYAVSNEDLRYVTALTQDKARRVLTVAGSGDQPLFYTLRGATDVDTFDVSFCAKAIMDMKVAAINQKVPYDDYQKILHDVHFAPSVARVDGVRELLNFMPADSAQFIRNMNGYKIFANGLSPESYGSQNLNKDEYQQLIAHGQKNFNFIWTDVAQLNTLVKGEYDLINLSNIFEWVPHLLIPVMEKMMPHLKVGGYMLVQTGHPMALHSNYGIFNQAQKTFGDVAMVGVLTKKRDEHIFMACKSR